MRVRVRGRVRVRVMVRVMVRVCGGGGMAYIGVRAALGCE